MDSDIDFSVFNENVFNNIIDGNKKSKLNFQLQRSPFSAFISIKKSFQKDRSGAMLLPSSSFMFQDDTMREQNESLIFQNKKLESELVALHTSLATALEKLETANNKIEDFEHEQCIKRERDQEACGIQLKLLNENIKLKTDLEDLTYDTENMKIALTVKML